MAGSPSRRGERRSPAAAASRAHPPSPCLRSLAEKYHDQPWWQVLEQLDEIKQSGGFTSVGKKMTKKSSFSSAKAAKGDIGRESTPLPARR